MAAQSRFIKPPPPLSAFVDFFWMIENPSPEAQDVVVLPDGRIDILFSVSPAEPYGVMLMGLGNRPSQNTILPGSKTFAISFNLSAAVYLPGAGIASTLNTVTSLADDFWGITAADMDNFEHFCQKVSHKMGTMIASRADERKIRLFRLIYAENGAMSVNALAEKVAWNSRQINRYFNKQFGLSLKEYCTILRFRASFAHLKEGKLYPRQDYTDQAHFIKEIKKFSGVVPKELSRNENDRFIHLRTLGV
ncbi:helix-turn-helix domain-containing protein [Hufsiella ginkgonis]|uniref:AraC family transcriptional regulator n=1 Tax=Hufsiella ginkgonis TaxID=2695274 RepID=A0A7K1XSJ2_9SPHI|nr:AraC family transcriptional regulator [Hufsiella ginkgonis]MXV13858.1 AraC family transcriptional regulator [Hufsiella ginkgonis]